VCNIFLCEGIRYVFSDLVGRERSLYSESPRTASSAFRTPVQQHFLGPSRQVPRVTEPLYNGYRVSFPEESDQRGAQSTHALDLDRLCVDPYLYSPRSSLAYNETALPFSPICHMPFYCRQHQKVKLAYILIWMPRTRTERPWGPPRFLLQ
jgi:hypothetical protein